MAQTIKKRNCSIQRQCCIFFLLLMQHMINKIGERNSRKKRKFMKSNCSRQPFFIISRPLKGRKKKRKKMSMMKEKGRKEEGKEERTFKEAMGIKGRGSAPSVCFCFASGICSIFLLALRFKQSRIFFTSARPSPRP